MGLKEEVIEMTKEVKEIKKANKQEQSLAWEMVKDGERRNKRQFIIILVILTMWFITIGYLVWVLNDIGVEETTTSQEINDVDTIENSNIANGDINGESKTN